MIATFYVKIDIDKNVDKGNILSFIKRTIYAFKKTSLYWLPR